MIIDKNREYWFGASDTAIVMGRWTSKTFAAWWLEKAGICRPTKFTSVAMLAGTEYEHTIADALSELLHKPLVNDRQIFIESLHLRVNLDSENDECIYEIKTFFDKGEEWKPYKAYIQQVRIQMWAAKKKGYICAYGLSEKNYNNFFLKIDNSKLILMEIEQDDAFIDLYLRRLVYLVQCLENGRFPKESEVCLVA